MSDSDWSEVEDEAQPKKGGVPKWVWWGCGCGCLLTLLVSVAAVLIIVPRAVTYVEEMADPEVQWARLQEVLPFDERPTGYDIFGTPLGVMDQYVLMPRNGSRQIKVQVFGSAAAADFDTMFDPDPSGMPFGLGAPQDGEDGTLEIQGQPCRFLRFSGIKGQPGGGGIRVDLSYEGSRATLVEILVMHGDGTPTDEEVLDFFSQFDVWRHR